MLAGKKILLIIGGGIAAYKSLELIRRLQDQGASVTPVLTRAGEEFVTPLSVSALSGAAVHRDLFDLTGCGGPRHCGFDGKNGAWSGQ
jgi:phosphopantothenoylcysteine decarboxylase/phosphopantothenate--cysteine ligase